MDTLTHTLFGMGIGALAGRRERTPEGRATDGGIFWGTLLGANLPDLDVLFMLGDEINHIKYHRGFSHSLLGAVLLTALLTAVLKWRFKKAQTGAVYTWSFISMIGHLFTDWITGFGTQLLSPFSDHRFALDWVAIVEPLMLLPLLAGLGYGLWRRRKLRQALVIGLLISSTWVFGRGVTHHLLLNRIEAAYEPADAVTVHPTIWSLTRWEYVVRTPDRYFLGEVDLSGSIQEYAAYTRKLAPHDQAVLTAAMADPRFQLVMDFARNPLVTVSRAPEGATVYVSDFRGGYAFNFHTTLDSGLTVTRIARSYDYTYQTAAPVALVEPGLVRTASR